MIVTDIKEAEGKDPVAVIEFVRDSDISCRLMEAGMQALAREFPSIVIAQVSINDDPVSACLYAVDVFPTIFVLKHGDIAAKLEGRMPIDFVRRAISQAVR